MIVLNLLCDHGHRFEAWFASAEEFRSQSRRHLVQCPQCQTFAVSQLPSAPHVKRGRSEVAVTGTPTPSAAEHGVERLHRALFAMARRAENVGDRFPEEARRIHYEEAPARTIRGVASTDETRELLDEGIFVLPAPVPPPEDFH